VATKVFINQDQEAKWEANRKMKMKIDLAAALAEQSGRLLGANPGRGRGNPTDSNQCPQDAPALGRN
jgi:hypothetical protein